MFENIPWRQKLRWKMKANDIQKRNRTNTTFILVTVTYFGPPHGKPYGLSDPKGQYVPPTQGPAQRGLLSPYVEYRPNKLS